ncbi:MAG: putative A(2 3)-sialyltransferase [Prokaryotic dsDNA virus sp.]|nr:MAG: putative A(2 3)-sialyltransferase [Prokaryotic dsDNA virus sp.]|tara:strand:- start:21632 stop:22300 length:669 start_codon:yes stop_codon:yes gene_type:complete
MKFLHSLKNCRAFLKGDIHPSDTCSVVGNSGVLLKQNNGTIIDSAEQVIRFNWAKCNGFENHVGRKTTIRVVNCHLILNIDNKEYFKVQKQRYPSLDRYELYNFKDEIIVFKTDPSWQLWKKKEIISKVEKNNEVFFIHEDFYNLAKKINNNKEASNGFIGVLLSLRNNVTTNCFGFSFYKDNEKKHYYEKVVYDKQHLGHNFDLEHKWFSLFEKNKLIKIY